MDILISAVCAALCGADSWVGVETVALAKEAWFRTFLKLENGMLSLDTFGDVFAKIDGEVFQTRFMRWVETMFRVTKGQVVALDGKTLRGSHKRGAGKDAIHLVNAWAVSTGIVLGQRKMDGKTNEITAIPELLRVLNMSGCIVTIDAMGCQKDIAQTIRDEKADYILCVKDNQRKLKQGLEGWFAYGDSQQFAGTRMDFHQTTRKTSGWIEIRRCWAVSDPLAFEHIRHYDGWTDLNIIVRVRRERRVGEKVSYETAYYISSLPADATQLLQAIQPHWAIENSFHWVMDVTFAEDRSRIPAMRTAMRTWRCCAQYLLKRDPSKSILCQKRFRATRDNDFLLHLLTQFEAITLSLNGVPCKRAAEMRYTDDYER